MKFNFRKIASVLASAVMLTSTAGMALAANYPAPFVVGGAADAAIVVTSGTHAGAVSDWDAAVSLQSALQGLVTTTATTTGATTTGGDSYKIERASTKFQLGRGALDVVSGTITDSEMPNLLVDGTFLDSDNDEKDYTQKIVLANFSLGMFDDNDYAEDTPTVGVRIASGSHVFNYTITFTDQPKWTKLETAEISLFGKEYYILDANAPGTNTSLTLLDSAESATIAEDETITIANKEVSVTFIGSNETKLSVDGEETNTLSEGQTYRLSDGTYVGIKDVMYTSKTGAVSKVEFSIGSGKLKLTHGQDIELNDDSVSRLKAYRSGATTLQSITIEWKADGDLFVAPDSEPELPGFKAVKLTWGGMTYPTEEEIAVEPGGDTYVQLRNFPLKDSTETINLLYGNSSNWTGIGKDSDNKLVTVGEGNLTFDADTDDYFVATYDDGTNAESYLMRATNFKTENSYKTNKTTLQYKSSGSWTNVQTDVTEGDTVTLGSVTLDVGVVNYENRTVELEPQTSVTFNTLYSKEGLKVYLPFTNSTAQNSTTVSANCSEITWSTGLIGPVNISNKFGNVSQLCYNDTLNLVFSEEDRNENKAAGNNVSIVLGWNSATTPQAHISDIIGESATFAEQDDTDNYESHVYSALATKILWDKSGDQYKATLTYHGGESYGNVFVAAPGVTVTEEAVAIEGGNVVVVKDTEVDSVKNNNLAVIGGSCINSVAAEVLGVSYPTCGDDFTAATNVGAGQYLIKAVASPYNAEKIAVLVAGYEAADTKNAAAKLREDHVTDAGTENIYPVTAA